MNPNDCSVTRMDKSVKTRTDRIYTTKGTEITAYDPEYLVDSDHLGVNVKLNLGTNEGRGVWKLNTQCLKSKGCILEVKDKLKTLVTPAGHG